MFANSAIVVFGAIQVKRMKEDLILRQEDTKNNLTYHTDLIRCFNDFEFNYAMG